MKGLREARNISAGQNNKLFADQRKALVEAGLIPNKSLEEYTVEEATPESFDGIDIVMASAGGSTSQKFAPEIIKRGGLIIDNSSAFRMEKDVPLVIAGVNDDDLRQHKGIIANPNCSTSQLMLALEPLNKKFGIKRLIVSTYQAVSGAGLAAINELREDTEANLKGEKFENKCFKKPISFNVIPQIDVFCENGYTKEEMKVVNETKKILHLADDTPISCTAARVPVFNGHSEAVDVEFAVNVEPNEVREILNNAYAGFHSFIWHNFSCKRSSFF